MKTPPPRTSLPIIVLALLLPGAAVPARAQTDGGPSKEETVAFLKQKIEGLEAIQSTFEPTSRYTKELTIAAYTALSVDGSCTFTLSYNSKVSEDSVERWNRRQPAIAFNLRDVAINSFKIIPEREIWAGYIEGAHVDFTVRSSSAGSELSIFMPTELGESFAKAIQHLSALCGAKAEAL